MFRRGAAFIFRFAQQSGARLSRVSAPQARRFVAGVASVQIGAAAVALTDRQLKKKPYWYKDAVNALEHVIKETSTYGYIESDLLLDQAWECLKNLGEMKNTEILWRYARVLVERAEAAAPEKKEAMLREAAAVAQTSFSFENERPSAMAHKWYAIALMKLGKFEKVKKINEIRTHLEKATEINPMDPHTWLLLGIVRNEARNYMGAIECFRKAEEIKPNFSAANWYHLGVAQKAVREKKAAIESFKKCYLMLSKYKIDREARAEAKKMLLKLKLKEDDFKPPRDY